jgi:hypothetical protein
MLREDKISKEDKTIKGNRRAETNPDLIRMPFYQAV